MTVHDHLYLVHANTGQHGELARPEITPSIHTQFFRPLHAEALEVFVQ